MRFASTAAALLATAVLPPLPAGAAEGPWHENPESRVRLVSPYAEAPAAGPWRLGLEFETQPGWHVYWKNSGDAGYPPVIDFAATPGASGVEIEWPAPERYRLRGDLEALGYEGQVVYPLALAIAPPAGETLSVAADLDYLVCEVECIPYRYTLTLEQPVAAAGGGAVEDPEAAALLAQWRARLPRTAQEAGVATEAAVDVSSPGEPVLHVRVEGAAAPGAEPDLFLAADERFDFGIPERMEAATGGGGAIEFRVPAAFWQVPDPMPAEVELAWTVTGLAVGGDGGATAIEARQAVPVGRAGLPPRTAGGGDGLSPGRLVLLLAGALAGGLLLHLAPTVLPLTVARALELAADAPAGHNAPPRAALATAAGAFAGGLGLGALALAARAGGRAVTWGTQLQEPLVVALLALAATGLALGLWGLFSWPLRRDEAAAAPAAGWWGGAAAGIATAALGLAWSLPPLPGSIGPALAAGTLPGLLAFAALGLGLALPWLVVAAAPRLVARLPRRGADGRFPAAARRLGEGLGFLAAGAVVWLLYLLSRQLRSDGLALVELLLLGLALVAWVRATARRRLLAAALAVVLAALAAATLWIADARRLVPRATDDAVAAVRHASGSTPHSSP
jgi:suppressor for copper-sensitivity B